MTSRKIQKSRSGSYLVSLPKGWVEESGLEKGDRVEIKELEKGSLSLQLTERESKSNYELNYENFSNLESLENTIKSCYMQGAETIKVKFGEKSVSEEKEKLRHVVLDLIGAEILKNGPDLVSYRVLVDPTKFSIKNLSRRIFDLVTSVQENAVEALEKEDPELVSGVSQRKKDADRLYRLMIRELKISASNKEVADSIGVKGRGDELVYTIAARDLSRMAHHSVRFAEIVHKSEGRLSDEDIDSILEISDLVSKMEKQSVRALLDKKIGMATDIEGNMDKVKGLTDYFVNNPSENSLDQELSDSQSKKCLDPAMCDLRTSLSRNLRRMADYSLAIVKNATLGAVSKYKE